MERSSNGKIIKGVGGLYSVKLLDSELLPAGSVVKCRARGSFRHEHITPLPGDNVTVLCSDQQKKRPEGGAANTKNEGFVIDTVQDRHNALIRPPMANLDCLFITMAAAAPVPILATVDKLISIAEFNRIEPIVIITKMELNPDYAEDLRKLYSQCGFPVFSVSAVTGEGIGELHQFIREALNGKISAFAGASGIGKSTLMNALFPNLCLSTSEISRKIERGRHTTRQVELFSLSDTPDSGYIADTPGFSMLDFERFDFFDKEDLPHTMREFIPYIGSCKYTKCSHTKEEGCAILEAVRKGKIPLSRHESYLTLYETLKQKKKWS